MTRLAVLADIHGNLPALEAVLADLAQFEVDQVIAAGDVINWGPFSAQVMERVTAGGWPAIRGNNEYYLLDYDTPRAPPEWSDGEQWPLLPWLRGQMSARAHRQIAAWPDSLGLRFPDAPALRVVHGSPRSNVEAIFAISPEAELQAMLAGVEEAFVVAAHTHLPMERSVAQPDGAHSAPWQIFNPGSVGVPLNGVHLARYMLLEGDAAGWRADWREVPIDPQPVLREFERQGFAEACGVVGELVLREFRNARLELLPFLRWRHACRPGAPFTPGLLADYAAVERWRYTPRAYLEAEQAAAGVARAE
jgi:predicted phosphodiesterase